MELVEVVASDEVDPEVLEAQQLFVALEFPARFGSKVMKHLSSNFQPLTELGFAHLKRLKKHPEAPKMLVALVCPLKSNDLASVTSSQELHQLEKIFEAKFTTAEALKLAPRTRELFEKHTRCWPLIFHASVEEAAALPPIEKEEKEKMEKHLRTAIQIGKQLKKERQKTLSCAWGCAIVDPELDAQVVASEVHGDMQVKYKYETLYHPVMVAVDGVAERDQRREAEDDEETARKKQKCVEAVNSEVAVDEILADKKQGESYLCTGYDVYLDREPCAMCAMALVHSRARRVLFDRANPSDGVLMSSFKLHTIKSLNHHYRVFQLALTSDEETE
ncbi:Cytidine and deoxycytidylate deaminase zinc-binding region [Phytophthora infestans]|uniref:Cytidine and deoxycytidylate deaminase zinc-binding region n=1 Tax=Phytophthora infestans TaxID=4787 RepID=A0A833TA44_PHYIN|nr:Cytidine and deoxycytidylate deaminase zinc-binding region [Phytophthora infestans]KAF4146899.1 Cytidine and deoxycytidylate deaminase zinc-binding region [Phytophthora infestans]